MNYSKTIYFENRSDQKWETTLQVYNFLLEHRQERRKLLKVGRQACSSPWDPILLYHPLLDLPIGLLYTSTDEDFCALIFQRINYLMRTEGCKSDAQKGRRRSLGHY